MVSTKGCRANLMRHHRFQARERIRTVADIGLVKIRSDNIPYRVLLLTLSGMLLFRCRGRFAGANRGHATDDPSIRPWRLELLPGTDIRELLGRQFTKARKGGPSDPPLRLAAMNFAQ